MERADSGRSTGSLPVWPGREIGRLREAGVWRVDGFILIFPVTGDAQLIF